MASFGPPVLETANSDPSASSASRPYTCCWVATRSARPRPRKLTTQCSTAVTRLLKPTMYIRCTTSHSTQAKKPSNLRFLMSATAEKRSEEHTSELQSRQYLVCRLLLEKKKALC